MTPIQASNALRTGKSLSVDLDTGIKALGLTIPYVFRHIDPTATDGKSKLAKFQKLCDYAGLPHDHEVFATWLTMRALRVEAGDAIMLELNCEASDALAVALGTVRTSTDAHIIRGDRANDDAISITSELPADGETGVIATPAGTIRFPGCPVTSTTGTWASALDAIDKVAVSYGRKAYDADPDAVVALDYQRPDRAGSVDADSIHEEWHPELAFHPDLKAHPAKLIQSATLATVTPPVATYRPRLPRRVISSGFISNSQFEFLVAAGEAHRRHLPTDPENPGQKPQRCGIYLADGTGAGKTNEILGAILDNKLHGRHKAVLVLAKRRHMHGFIEAWAKMGQDKRDFTFQWKAKSGADIRHAKGILVTTYSTLREYSDAEQLYPRVEQIARWTGDDWDGVMAFDEAQEMRNAAGTEDVSGKSETSRQGLAGVELQDRLYDARVIWGSATGATDVHNLGYATRLGLWGPSTCFNSRSDFIRTIEEGGIADLEQVTLSLKAAGLYVARSLSFDGVETRHLSVTLTADERRTYNEAAEAWIKLLQTAKHCAKLCAVPVDDDEEMAKLKKTHKISGKTPFSELNGIFESSRKNSMATLIAAFKARAVIADAKIQIENGYSPVIQMQNTYEAQLDRALDRLEDPKNIRLEPAELVAFAERIPHEVQTLEAFTTAKGEEMSRWVTKKDASGNPVLHPVAEQLRNQAIAEVRTLKLPLPPLDQIMLAFGPARLAEVTGRTKRLIPNKPNGDRDGATGVLLEDRTEKQRISDIEAFHNGTKQALVFSTGAGGSSLSYHAKTGTKNTARRIHYVIQLGYRADEVTQGFGRTHRSDQVQPPILTITSCDLPADRLYASRIVSSLFRLGALTQGHRHATSNGMFDERDCLDGPYAEGAWEDLQADISEGKIEGYSWEQFMSDLGLTATGEATEKKWDKTTHTYVLTNVNKMINRVAALTDRRQDIIFDHLRERIDGRIEKAIAEGTFNAGPETLKATSLEIIGEKIMQLDDVHHSSTRLLRIRKRSELTTTSFGDAYKTYLSRRHSIMGRAVFCKHATTGQVALICPGRAASDMLGRKIATKDIITPTGSANRYARLVEREPWRPFTDMELMESLWNAQVEAAPQEATSYVTLVADALLPIWTALAQASGYRNAVYRLQTDDGRQIVGRPLSAGKLEHFMSCLQESAAPTDSEVAEITEQLKTGARVAVATPTKHPHFIFGEFTGDVMTGLSIDLGAAPCTSLSNALNFLPTQGAGRGPGAILTVASTAKGVQQALSAILACCPAIFVEEDDVSSQAAGNGQASQNPAGTAGKVAVPATASAQAMVA